MLGEQEASQASLYDINAQLTLWQNALESRRPGKIARVDAVLEEIAEAKKKLGTRSIFSNCMLRDPVQSFVSNVPLSAFLVLCRPNCCDKKKHFDPNLIFVVN